MKKKVVIGLGSTLGIICLGVGGLTLRFPQWKFFVGDTVNYMKRAEKPELLGKDDMVAWQETNWDDLLSDSRVEYNQSLMLINTEYMIKNPEEAQVSEYKDSGVCMNNCIQESYSQLSKIISDKFGESLYVRSAYRSAKEQQDEIDEVGDIATSVGASEHQQGLALDVYIKNYAGAAFLKSKVGQYVNMNCADYGFIIRYPYYGTKETGIGYEPWHIRYVGQPHAAIIMENHMTLEEYVEQFEYGVWYGYEGYYISRQKDDAFLVPDDFVSAVVSPDNIEGYWITLKMG